MKTTLEVHREKTLSKVQRQQNLEKVEAAYVRETNKVSQKKE